MSGGGSISRGEDEPKPFGAETKCDGAIPYVEHLFFPSVGIEGQFFHLGIFRLLLRLDVPSAKWIAFGSCDKTLVRRLWRTRNSLVGEANIGSVHFTKGGGAGHRDHSMTVRGKGNDAPLSVG